MCFPHKIDLKINLVYNYVKGRASFILFSSPYDVSVFREKRKSGKRRRFRVLIFLAGIAKMPVPGGKVVDDDDDDVRLKDSAEVGFEIAFTSTPHQTSTRNPILK